MIEKKSTFYLGQIKRVWKHLPESLRQSSIGISFGRHIHRQVQKQATRKQFFGTFFLRNRAELQTICRLVGERQRGRELSLAVIACSKGAEVYSIVWALRRQFPEVDLRVRAVDISAEILEFAAKGVYSVGGDGNGAEKDRSSSSQNQEISFHTSVDQNAPIFERVSSEELDSIAEVRNGVAYVKEEFKRGIEWVHGDAFAPDLLHRIGKQDIVIANRFLCHMRPDEAERCLKNVARLVKPNGYIFVTGIDLEVRTKVAGELQWKPLKENMRAVHEGDSSLRRGWPLEYWGVEPFGAIGDQNGMRYSCIFQVPSSEHPDDPGPLPSGADALNRSKTQVFEERIA